MNHFNYKGDELYVEEVSLQEIVASVGSRETVEELLRGREHRVVSLNRVVM